MAIKKALKMVIGYYCAYDADQSYLKIYTTVLLYVLLYQWVANKE